MNKSYLVILAAALAAVPLALADPPTSGPKTHCEDPSEWNHHHYGPPADGALLAFFIDGAVPDCDGDGIAPGTDGHSEYALGGAWFLVDSGDLATYGTIACFGEPGHHPFYGPFTVVDDATGPAEFFVGADTTVFPDPTTGVDCGDFVDDEGVSCVNTCKVTFPPGRDGAYHVYVVGTSGTAIS